MPNDNFAFNAGKRGSAPFEKIAHRGASGLAPENTFPAFELAFEKYGCDGVEMDVHLTKDEVPVVIHDATLERTTNGRGFVESFRINELKELDAGYWFETNVKGEFPFRGKGVTIPALEEVLIRFPNSKFFLELKDRRDAVVEKTLEILNRVPHPSRVIIGSFSGRTARRLRRLATNRFETFLTEDEVVRACLAFLFGFKRWRLPARYASLPRSKYGISLDGTRWIEFLRKGGVKVYYWTVNDVEEIEELARRGANGILTDYPDRWATNP